MLLNRSFRGRRPADVVGNAPLERSGGALDSPIVTKRHRPRREGRKPRRDAFL